MSRRKQKRAVKSLRCPILLEIPEDPPGELYVTLFCEFCWWETTLTEVQPEEMIDRVVQAHKAQEERCPFFEMFSKARGQ